MKLAVTLCTGLLLIATGCATSDVLGPPYRDRPEIRDGGADPLKDVDCLGCPRYQRDGVWCCGNLGQQTDPCGPRPETRLGWETCVPEDDEGPDEAADGPSRDDLP